MIKVENSFKKLKSYCEKENFMGWDPYDGLNSTIFQSLPIVRSSKLCRLTWIQLFKRNPINLRDFFQVEKGYNPKGLALFLIGYCNLYEINKEDKILNKINFLADKLISLSSKGYAGSCWGYNFDWQARAFYQPKYTPTVVVTSFVVNALFRAYELTQKEEYYTHAISSSKFVLEDLNRSYDNQGNFSFSYSPLDQTQVFNASLLGARILVQAYKYTGNEVLLNTAEMAFSYVCNKQNNNGSWHYSTLHYHQWVDSFHTGFNLECLYDHFFFTSKNKYEKHIEKGLTFYIDNFFTKDGKSKYYSNSTYPIDMHSPAQLVVTLSKLKKFKKNKKLIDKVLEFTIDKMQSNEGYFFYQLKRYSKTKIPYMRWTQAWMFYAFSYYLKEIHEE